MGYEFEHEILFKEIQEYLTTIDTDVWMKDEIDDHGRRYHFHDEYFLIISFTEEGFNVKHIEKILKKYSNIKVSPSRSFTENCQYLDELLTPLFKMKNRKRKIENILKDG